MATGTSNPGRSAAVASNYTPDERNGSGVGISRERDTSRAVSSTRGTSESANEQRVHYPPVREDGAQNRLGDNSRNRLVQPVGQIDLIEGTQRNNPPRNTVSNNQLRRHSNDRCHKRTKVSIKIAALNIKGHGNVNIDHTSNKWADIRLTMLQRQIGILVIGEAHMNAERRQEIERVYEKDLKIYYTKLPNTPNAAGVAIALNKNITNSEGIQTYEVVEGHALLMETYWHENEKISILAIYAPNADAATNTTFWKKVQEFFTRNPRIQKPDFVLGDMNFVEEPLDRLPARSDPGVITEAFDELKRQLRLEDGWRNTYPSSLKYTYKQKRTNQLTRHSRLDRIYTKSDNMQQSYEWQIEQVGISTDHDMVSVRFTCENTPMTGKGRWIFPVHLIYDKVVKEFIENEGKLLEQQMDQVDQEEERDPNNNHQTLWANFKHRFTRLARERAKIVIPRINKEIAILKTKIDTISDDPLLSDDERSLSTAVLKETLTALEKQKLKSARSTAKGNYSIQGETISRYWSNLNKNKKKRDLILRLQIPHESNGNGAGPQIEPVIHYETNTQRMADMMRNHHELIQQDTDSIDQMEREQITEQILNAVTVKISDAHKTDMKRKLTTTNVEEALKLSANYKAPGLDGICYEIWKIIHARCKNAQAHRKKAFNIVEVLKRVFNDIETFGMVSGTRFSESWMCPLYKKNDRAQMENYRPISLLNSDYKIMSKALTIKL
ncbi:hypothetical protein F5877DRAFT_54765, partial [Lentinula edodes]